MSGYQTLNLKFFTGVNNRQIKKTDITPLNTKVVQGSMTINALTPLSKSVKKRKMLAKYRNFEESNEE